MIILWKVFRVAKENAKNTRSYRSIRVQEKMDKVLTCQTKHSGINNTIMGTTIDHGHPLWCNSSCNSEFEGFYRPNLWIILALTFINKIIRSKKTTWRRNLQCCSFAISHRLWYIYVYMYHVPNKTLPVNVATYPFRPMDPSWGTLWAYRRKIRWEILKVHIFWRPTHQPIRKSILCFFFFNCLPATRWGPKTNCGPSGGPFLSTKIGVKISPHFFEAIFLGGRW